MLKNRNKVRNLSFNINNLTIVSFNIIIISSILIITNYSRIFFIYLLQKQQGGSEGLQ